MICVKDLKKSFHTQNGEIQVLNGINQTIKKGEKVVVIGPSGSGKSTFLRCLNLLEQPTSGEVWFEDTLINAVSYTHLDVYKRQHQRYAKGDFFSRLQGFFG